MDLFHDVSLEQASNKMTPHNLAIVLAPNILWKTRNDGDVVSHASSVNDVIALSLMHWNQIRAAFN